MYVIRHCGCNDRHHHESIPPAQSVRKPVLNKKANTHLSPQVEPIDSERPFCGVLSEGVDFVLNLRSAVRPRRPSRRPFCKLSSGTWGMVTEADGGSAGNVYWVSRG